MVATQSALPDDQREPNDAYWTPKACARACLQEAEDAARLVMPGWSPRRVLEPCVGGGAWVVAARERWPEVLIDRCDLNPSAPGLVLDHRAGEELLTGDFLRHAHPTRSPRHLYDAVIGNPPYKGDPLAWFDRAIRLAPVVTLVLRATILGSRERFGWWQENSPARVTVLTPRPLWEGPGARPTTDTVDSVLITWVHGHEGPAHMGWRIWR